MAGELSDILERLESSLAPRRGDLRELDGGITNRNFRVTLGDADYVIRRPGKDTGLLGIDRESEHLANDAAAQLGVAPAVAIALEDCLVTRFIESTPLSSAEVADGAEEIARALRRFHGSTVRLPTRFSVPALLENYSLIVRRRGGELPGEYAEAVSAAARVSDALTLDRACPCHNDLLAGNLIRAVDDGRIMIIDWEYAGMGDPRFDLGNLSINNDFDQQADDRLLNAYYGEQPSRSRRAALKLMRVLSDAREAAWGVVQGQISELDFDFAGYAMKHFKRMQDAVSQPSFEGWLASARD